MPTIFAIGGGEIAEGEPRPIDEAVVEATDTDDPHALFLPTASGDAVEYAETLGDYYGTELGRSTDCLAVADAGADDATVAEKTDAADAVYVGGGDTGYMLDTWRTRGIDEALREAWRDGTVMAGLSAGALCWFTGGLSDAIALDDVAYGPVAGLDVVPDLHATVHATPERRAAFLEYLAVRDAAGVALETRRRWRYATTSGESTLARRTPSRSTSGRAATTEP